MRNRQLLGSMMEQHKAFLDGRIQQYYDIINLSR
jgi:hypothetical protein